MRKVKIALLSVFTILSMIVIINTSKVNATVTSDNLLENGSFETGDTTGWSYEYYSTNGKIINIVDVSDTAGQVPTIDEWAKNWGKYTESGYADEVIANADGNYVISCFARCNDWVTEEEKYVYGAKLYQEVDLSSYPTGSSLSFSAVYGNSPQNIPDNGGLMIEYLDANNNVIKTDETGPQYNNMWNGFAPISLDSTMPSGAIKAKVSLMGYVGTPWWIDAYYDNAKLSVTVPSADFVDQNGNSIGTASIAVNAQGKVDQSYFDNANSLLNIDANHVFEGWIDQNGNPVDANTLITSDKVISPVISQKVVNQATLTITYEYSDGTSASKDYVEMFNEGQEYSIKSPTISGYTASIEVVKGIMGKTGTTIKVVYHKNGVTNASNNQVNSVNESSVVNTSDSTNSSLLVLMLMLSLAGLVITKRRMN